jgi:hypothetical protein
MGVRYVLNAYKKVLLLLLRKGYHFLRFGKYFAKESFKAIHKIVHG